MKKSPCFGCTDRTAKCALQNNDCERYRNWKAEHDAAKASQQSQDTQEYRFRSYKKMVYEKNDKRRRHACGEE